MLRQTCSSREVKNGCSWQLQVESRLKRVAQLNNSCRAEWVLMQWLPWQTLFYAVWPGMLAPAQKLPCSQIPGSTSPIESSPASMSG